MSRLLVPEHTQQGYINPPAAVATLAESILVALDKAYPGYTGYWRIQIDTKGGVINVTHDFISGKMGFTVAIKTVKADPTMKKMVYFAGELLERYRLSREKKADVTEEVANMKRNSIGEAEYDE